MADLSNIQLRILTNALLSTKGSRLTMQELDQNIIELAELINALNGDGGGSITAYSAGTTYTGGSTYYVSYSGNIYKFISATDQTGKTPDSFPAIWELSSAGAMTHQQNTDQYLDLNGDYEISVSDIYNFIARYNGILKPAKDFADGLSAPPTTVSGDIYIIQEGVTISSTAINWQSGTTVRFTYAGGTDLSSYSTGMYLDVQNAADSAHDGIWLISTVNDGSDYIEVTNPNITSAANDSTTSDTYVSHSDWGGVAQNDWVVKDAITNNWERVVPFDGLSCHIESFGGLFSYKEDTWLTSGMITKVVTVSTAEVKNLNGAAKTLISAPGSGKLINVVRATFFLDYNTTDYVATGIGNLYIQYNGATGGIGSLGAAILEASADRFAQWRMPLSGSESVDIDPTNKAVEMYINGGNPTLGDSPVIVVISYSIEKLS